ncbi:MAG: acetate--CoA ligase family protein [Thermoplasmata archaeon]|nr:acetate--CoA ligase family protein [Thermoplasmata archaeon]
MSGKVDLKALFEPKSVAVVGASSNPAKIGHKVLSNILAGGYHGEVYPVNPKGGEILGLKVYKRVAEIEGAVDLAVVVVPAPVVFDVVQDCAAAKVKFLIIITSGFSEVGNRKEEKKIVDFARKHGMRVLGPNVFGMYSAKVSLNASFGPSKILPGKIAIITQSGALGGAMIGKSVVDRIGLSAIISVGNKSDLDEADLLQYLKEDEQTKVVLMYIEGVKNGNKLVRILKDMPEDKHVVVIKSGKSKRGALAAASHTGSLAGSDNVFNGIAEQCGILRAESVNEAFNWSRALSELPLVEGDNTVIITNGGGLGVMCADACEKYSVPLMDDSVLLQNIFKDVMPEFGSARNPVDLTGEAGVEEYKTSLKKALNVKEINAVLALYCETGIFEPEGMSKMVVEMDQIYKKNKPILFSMLGGEKVEEIIDVTRKKGTYVFDDVYDAASALGALYRRKRFIEELKHLENTPDIIINEMAIRRVISKARSEDRRFLMPDEAKEIMKLIGLTLPRWRIARSLDEAVSFAEEIGYPVVLKIVSEDIIHKTDAGGVALDLENKNEVIDAYQAIMKSCRTKFPKARIRGIEVCEMVPRGVETIVGGTFDPSFGPVVMFGLGGIYVETLKDVTFRAVPLALNDAKKMVRGINAYPILLGVRGEKRKDIEGIVDVLLRVGKLMEKIEDVSDVEINPLMVYEYGKGVKVVDVRILLKEEDV